MTTSAPPTPETSRITLHHGHALDVLRTLPSCSVDCCVTSPPYWGLRDYHTEDLVWDEDTRCSHEWQAASVRRSYGAFCTHCCAWRGNLGLEPTPDLYISHLVSIFRELRRVLNDSGTLWLVLGDCYAGSWGNYRAAGEMKQGECDSHCARSVQPDGSFVPLTATASGVKRKDRVGIPWMAAFALRADGWYLRSDVVWHKPNCMPEPVKDRPTCAHEYVFLLSKSPRYYYDTDAIREPVKTSSILRGERHVAPNRTQDQGHPLGRRHALRPEQSLHPLGRNRRSVWSISTSPFRGPHFATFPKELVRPCIKAGAPVGGVVIDPFAGTGTVGIVCQEEGRQFSGIELNPEYIALAESRPGFHVHN